MENTLYFGEEGRHAEKDSQYFQNYTDCIIIVSLPNQLREIRKEVIDGKKEDNRNEKTN